MQLRAHPMTTACKDAASARRQQLAAQLLRGEGVMVTQQGEIRPLSERGSNEVAITVPEGKLAAPSLYWYERETELFPTELEASQLKTRLTTHTSGPNLEGYALNNQI